MPDGRKARTRQQGCIHVDLDSLWATGKSLGLDIDIDPDPVLHSSVDNFLSLFEEYGIQATFFITGRDASRRSNAPLINKILGGGHEIANHSMNHRPNFTKLKREEIEAEIVEGGRAIEEATGSRCRGFRAPTYNVNGFILRTLQENGYAYDSSILPTFISPVYRMINSYARKRSLAYGSARHAAAPIRPYHPDEQRPWKRGTMDIVEVPITTMPFLRLPFHCSYVFQTGIPLFRLGAYLFRLSKAPLVYLFHARELAKDTGDLDSELPFRALPLARRRAIYRAILDTITGRFNVVATRELVEGVRGAAA